MSTRHCEGYVLVVSLPSLSRLVICGVFALLGSAGCQTTQPNATPATSSVPSSVISSPSPTGEPRTYDAAKAAVDRLDAFYAKEDGGSGWDMMTASGQAAMSRDDYIAVVKGCPKLFKVDTHSIALNSSGNIATVTVADQDGITYSWNLIYEGGWWKYQPSTNAMKWLQLTADQALKFLRGGGSC